MTQEGLEAKREQLEELEKSEREARRLEEAARVLEAELAEHRARAAKDVGPVPPLATNVPRLRHSAA